MASYIVEITEIMTGIIPCRRIIESNLFRRLSSDVCHDICFTLRFFLGTSGVAESSANEFPAVSAPIGQFLLKGIVLLAASLCLLSAFMEIDMEKSTS